MSVVDTLALLRPVGLRGPPLVRLGNPLGDGGYVAADLFERTTALFSYGVGREVSFDRDLAERGIDVHMFDHTVDGPPEAHDRFHFVREGVASAAHLGPSLGTLADHLAQRGHLRSRHLVLKMDIEGHEWDVLDAAPERVLAAFEQIVIEVHGLNRLGDAVFRRRAHRVLARLRASFHVIHVHANNVRGLVSVAGLAVAPILEITYLRRDLADPRDWTTVLPRELDAPNVDRADHVLSFFPFVPALPEGAMVEQTIQAGARAVRTSAERVQRLEHSLVRRGVDIAPSGTSTQSSLSRWSRHPGEAMDAVGRRPDGGWSFHTGEDPQPWWCIDFGQPVRFDEVIVFNRLGRTASRAHPLQCETSDDGRDWQVRQTSTAVFGGADGRPLRIAMPGTDARMIRLRVLRRSCLHLDAVEVRRWDQS